jgi:hypothetical protein
MNTKQEQYRHDPHLPTHNFLGSLSLASTANDFRHRKRRITEEVPGSLATALDGVDGRRDCGMCGMLIHGNSCTSMVSFHGTDSNDETLL